MVKAMIFFSSAFFLIYFTTSIREREQDCEDGERSFDADCFGELSLSRRSWRTVNCIVLQWFVNATLALGSVI